MPHRILLVEDDPGHREVLQLALEQDGFEIQAVPGLTEAKIFLEGHPCKAVITDLRLKDGSGMDLLAWAREKNVPVPIVVMTAFATTEITVQALNLGAVDFLTKPFQPDDLSSLLKNVLAPQLPAPDYPPIEIGDLVGVSDVIRRIQALIGKIALADTTVLLTGESGTGKEVVARLIHRYSERSRGPFVAVNCGALPENLLESELFGYEKGSFTGANQTKRGLFEEAVGGILFLDEIGEMPLPLQVKLLRVLQERKVRRVGSHEERPVDLRIIAATNRRLMERVRDGLFREDLYYRLNILGVELPPLRERPSDIPVLAEHFIARFCRKLRKAPMSLSSKVHHALSGYGFPGNVRELENIMERAVALNPGGPITEDLLPDSVRDAISKETSGSLSRAALVSQDFFPPGPFDLEAWLTELRAWCMHQALEEASGFQTQACKRLGMSFRSFRYWHGKLAPRIPTMGRQLPQPSDFPVNPDSDLGS